MVTTKKKKIVRIHSRSDRPENVLQKESEVFEKCGEIQEELPEYLRGFFRYLRSDVLPMTQLAYLRDILAFFRYLTEETRLTKAKTPRDITLEELNRIRAADVNRYLDYCRRYQVENGSVVTVYENGNKTLARKKSSLSVLFRQLYREELLKKNITDGFNPIRVQKPGEREIKALRDEEVREMLEAVTTGNGLTEHEKAYWEKTKKRDKAILVLFLTYGLRLSELQQLNLSSFNLRRGEFKIYRKRGKESVMPMNQSVTKVLRDYIETERPSSEKLDEESRDALFLSMRGRRMTARQIRELVKKYTSIVMHTSRKAGYSPHKLRATAATSLIERGNSIFDVAALLDHEQVTTTQLYARPRQNAKEDLVRDMEWETEREEREEQSEEGDNNK